MLKTLQVYTIFIVVLVIVLSQITLTNNSGQATRSNGYYQSGDKATKTSKQDKLIDEIKDSKYAEPINQIKGILFSLNKSVEEVKKSFSGLEDALDLEKNLNDLYNVFEE